MCGIAGIISVNPNEISTQRLKSMTDAIAHRGPDGDGHWISANGKVGLGHRRLSIIDLSHEADQPMHYLDRYSLVFNGEIYNYLELKETLVKQGYQFHTQSDTEVLIALFDKHREHCLSLLDGMFAFVLYDQVENKAFIARDRFGEKPFFYSFKEGQYFLFGSEMKALWAGGIKKEVSNRMLFNYLSLGYIENPEDLSETFYEGCIRLSHSHYMWLDVSSLRLTTHSYYDIDWKNVNHSITLKQASEKFKELFYTSVIRRLRSDVPVGSSLSGGLDSSLVVCTIDDLRKGSTLKQTTFSAVFPGFEKDERKYMDLVINQTKVDPYFVTPSDEQLIVELDQLSWHQEEPYLSASIFVQFKVMELAKTHGVTVLLDGQGADEILAGYHHYYNSFFNELKVENRQVFKDQYRAYSDLHMNNPINGISSKTLGDRIRDISPALIKPVKRLKLRVGQYRNPMFTNDFLKEHEKTIFNTPGNNYATLNEALYQSTFKFGLQQLLRYADRNSMAHSREVRLPFLYHELVDFLFTLPSSFKINQGWSKWIMRETFNILPELIAWRKDKIGFEPPQKQWLNSPNITDRIEDGMKLLKQQGILHANSSCQKQSNDMIWRKLVISNILSKH